MSKLNQDQIDAVAQWIRLNHGELASVKFQRDFLNQVPKKSNLDRCIEIMGSITEEDLKEIPKGTEMIRKFYTLLGIDCFEILAKNKL